MSNQETNDRVENLLKIGIGEGLIVLKNGRLIYPHCNKSYNFADPEEKIRGATYVDLIVNYQYPPERIDLEVYPPRRVPKLPADVVVFEDDRHDHTYVVVEVKPTGQKAKIDEAKREGLGNANLLNPRYLLLVCGPERMAYDVEEKPSLSNLEKFTIADIPKRYGNIPRYKYKKADKNWDLRRASFNELDNKLQLCHDEIWEGGRRDPAIAFDEISKLMFTKIFDERFTVNGEFYKFQVGTHEEPSEVAQRIKEELYDKARVKEPDVFNTDIELPSKIIFRIVEVLQDVSLIHTDLDAKGRAFENFLGKLFRGEYGQYFTRREIVQFMVNTLDPDERHLIIDPACGSGGFLLYSLKHVRDKIKWRYRGDQRAIDRIDWDFAHNQIYGIEINDRIARVAMMDMVIHEDGHSNIETNDALIRYEEFDARKDIKPGKYDIVITNPPFGAAVKDNVILKKFELGGNKASQRTEALFIERCLDMLKPGGRMAIVVPDGILTTVSQQYIRDWINRNAKIVATVSLPACTFVPAGSGVKASILYLQKRSRSDSKKGYSVFMAMAEHVGYDATGRPDENDLPAIAENYKKFSAGEVVNEPPLSFIINESDLEGRIDPYYYQPEFLELDGIMAKSRYTITTLGEMMSCITGGATPTVKTDAYADKEDGVPFLRIQNVAENDIDLTDVKYITKETHNTLLQRSQLETSDILFTITGRIGTAAVIPDDFGEGNINQHIVKMTLKKDLNINPYYVAAFLNSRLGNLQALRKATGATRIALDYQAIRSIKIPIPPRDLQDQTALAVSEAKKEAEELRNKAEEIIKLSKEQVQKSLWMSGVDE